MHYNKVLVCDIGGQPHHWASWQDGIVLKYKNLLSYELGDATAFYGGTSRLLGTRSEVMVGQIVFLRESLKYDARIPPLTNQNLFARDLNICAYCGRHFAEHKLSRDHVEPVSKGGKNVWQNVVTACKPCNHLKDDLPLGKAVDEDGNKMALAYVPYVPTHVERLIMQNRNVLVDQMSFLTNFLPEHSRIKSNPIKSRLCIEVPIPSFASELPVKRHFYSATEMSAMKHAEEVANSQNRRRKVPKY